VKPVVLLTTLENRMSALVSQFVEFVRSTVRSLGQVLRRSPWLSATVAAMIVVLYLV